MWPRTRRILRCSRPGPWRWLLLGLLIAWVPVNAAEVADLAGLLDEVRAGLASEAAGRERRASWFGGG